jgi:hypothetical protein
MNNLNQKSIIIFGILVASIIILSNISYGKPMIIDHSFQLEQNYQLTELQTLVNEIDPGLNNEIIKIYNSSDELIYETRDQEDERIQILIIKSDFLTEINKIKYFKLTR